MNPAFKKAWAPKRLLLDHFLGEKLFSPQYFPGTADEF